MGLLQDLAAHPLAQQFQLFSPAAQISMVLGGVVALSIFLHVAKQILFKNPNEPPMVFSWFPFIGSTVTYGMDPPKFFKENREKVGAQLGASLIEKTSETGS